MNINVAKSAGFCFGVNRAVNMVYSLLEEDKKVCTFGPIILNMEMVRELQEKGCVAVSDIADVPNDATLVIRSHGIPLDMEKQINDACITCSDATCPFVKKIHKIVEKESSEGRIIFVAGNKTHPEVEGIISYCKGELYAFNNNEELFEIADKFPFENNKPISVVAQTTFSIKEWK